MQFAQRAILLIAVSAGVLAAAPGQDGATVSGYLRQAPAKEFYLPEGLREISGLAVASNNTVYTHDDNYAIVYEVDLNLQKAIKAFALGKPTVKGDFEDIAVRDGYVEGITRPLDPKVLAITAVECLLIAIWGYRFFNKRKWEFAERL